jgi:hypothetical protein
LKKEAFRLVKDSLPLSLDSVSINAAKVAAVASRPKRSVVAAVAALRRCTRMNNTGSSSKERKLARLAYRLDAAVSIVNCLSRGVCATRISLGAPKTGCDPALSELAFLLFRNQYLNSSCCSGRSSAYSQIVIVNVV